MGMIPKNVENTMKGNKMMNSMFNKAASKVPEQMATFVDQNKEILEVLNEHTKAIVSLYNLVEAIADEKGIKKPKPLVDMSLE